MRMLRAFSLVELMVVIAVVATLATVAAPTYREHMLRAKVSSLVGITSTVKVDVVEDISMGTVFGTATETKIATGASNKPAYLSQLVRAAYGCIAVYYDVAQLNLSGDGDDLVMMICPALNATSGIITWSCGYSATTNTAYAVYLPANCRQAVTQDTAL